MAFKWYFQGFPQQVESAFRYYLWKKISAWLKKILESFKQTFYIKSDRKGPWPKKLRILLNLHDHKLSEFHRKIISRIVLGTVLSLKDHPLSQSICMTSFQFVQFFRSCEVQLPVSHSWKILVKFRPTLYVICLKHDELSSKNGFF